MVPTTHNELERVAIATAITYTGAAYKLLEIIKDPKVFIVPEHQALYWALSELSRSGDDMDFVLICKKAEEDTRFQADSISAYAVGILEASQAPAIIETYCFHLLNDFVKRRLPTVALQVKNLIDSHKPYQELLSEAHLAISKLEEEVRDSNVKSFKEMILETQDTLIGRSTPAGGVMGFGTGVSALDAICSGWQEGMLAVIAGRPGMGKTALALKTTLHNAKRGVPVLFFSREMSAKELIKRLVAMDSAYFNMPMLFSTGIPKDKRPLLGSDLKRLSELPITIDEDSADLDDILFKIKQFHLKHKAGVVVIDSVGLVKGYKSKRYQNDTAMLTDITRELKQTARSTDMPIIILSQLNRDVESRPNKFPRLSDLKMSGSIEEDANLVIFPYRADHYDFDLFPGTNILAKGKAMLIVAKNRNGSVDSCICDYLGHKVLFQDSAPHIDPELLTIEQNDDRPF